MQTVKKKYKPLVSHIKKWPIIQLSKKKEELIQQTIEESYSHILSSNRTATGLCQLLENIIQKEKARTTHYNWRVDKAQKEADTWKEYERLLLLSKEDKATEEQHYKDLLKKIISHYVHEIVGGFGYIHYCLARNIVMPSFAYLLNAVRILFWALRRKRPYAVDKVHAIGEIEHIRKLAEKGTLVILPTHFSHIDPVLIGWALCRIGLPPFMYGAGINLFNARFFSYLLYRFGTYKIDRRKKNSVYLRTLQTFTKGIIKHGCHSLFFPSGGRSRNGSIETRLKLGLLNTSIAAQREFYEESNGASSKKVFLVPVVINYDFVPEAPHLIHEHLKSINKLNHYKKNSKYSTSYKIFKSLFAFLSKESYIPISIGRGLDVLGNYVNDDGKSIDKHGQVIDIRDYFLVDGKVAPNLEQEQVYTHNLAKRVLTEFYKHNQVLCSHVVAFAAFEMIKQKYADLELYSLLHLPEKDISIPYAEFEAVIAKLQAHIHKLKAKGELKYEETIDKTASDVIQHGIANCGVYHPLRPLFRRKTNHEICTQDLCRLYYYHNRLCGYGLDSIV